MITNMFNKLSNGFSRIGSDHKTSVRNSRTNRRYSIGQGIEGLEGRLALSGGFAPVASPAVTDVAPSTSVSIPPFLSTVTNDPAPINDVSVPVILSTVTNDPNGTYYPDPSV